MNFSEKVILITGAGSGIGEDTAIAFARFGAKVALVDLSEDNLNKVYQKITKNGSTAPYKIIADVTKDAFRIVDETVRHFGKLDVLVNNAGICKFDSVSTINLEIFDQIFAVNVRSVVELTKLAIPHLEKTKGNIVILSSILGLQPFETACSYGLSKTAINMYSKCASLELAPRGIRVNSVNPGVIRTPFYEKLGIDETEVKNLFDTQEERYPIGRLGSASDVTNAILFLASERTSFITGVSLVVDGGRLNA